MLKSGSLCAFMNEYVTKQRRGMRRAYSTASDTNSTKSPHLSNTPPSVARNSAPRTHRRPLRPWPPATGDSASGGRLAGRWGRSADRGPDSD
ncbi:hypothetical protein EVAR_94381_1 [Eumeta japonica]|uniref:Uncharacterized protein n=1 Tax=Eumeta variegata TaxID=151549 RepID=A0A4C1TPY7_EUMVA|nr:hypothetical protein EVAR_94381_1 [Eumeta japonica]